MARHLRVVHTLRSLLSATAGTAPHALLGSFVHDCSAMALALIQSKIASGTIHPSRFGLTPADMAFDSIADLFVQDPDGSLVQIVAYFEGIPWQTMEDEELLIHLRRLLFARTNQGLFRMFQEIDPALGKILRNTKLAIGALSSFDQMDHFGEPCIAPSLCDPLTRVPMIDRDALERRLLEITRGNERIPDILAKLSIYLREQDEHSRMVPILWVAYAIRKVYSREDHKLSQQPEIETALAEEDVRAALCAATRSTHAQYREKYVTPGGLTQEIYDRYFEVIELILVKRLISSDGHDVSLFKQLQERVPGMTQDEYNATHRSKLEYLARIAEQKAVAMLKRNL